MIFRNKNEFNYSHSFEVPSYSKNVELLSHFWSKGVLQRSGDTIKIRLFRFPSHLSYFDLNTCRRASSFSQDTTLPNLIKLYGLWSPTLMNLHSICALVILHTNKLTETYVITFPLFFTSPWCTIKILSSSYT